jgi:YgiT-type zinc finger domain-containing protein
MRKRKLKKEYNYGKCHVCDSKMEEKPIEQDFWIKGKLIIIEDIPAGVCRQCGEKIVKADVGRWIANVIENSDRIEKAPKISVPMLKYDSKEVIS